MPLVLSIKTNGNSVKAGEIKKRADQTYVLPIYIPLLTMHICFQIMKSVLVFFVIRKE